MLFQPSNRPATAYCVDPPQNWQHGAQDLKAIQSPAPATDEYGH